MRADRFTAAAGRTLDDTVAEALLDIYPEPYTVAVLALTIYGSGFSDQQQAEVEAALGRLMATGRACVAPGSVQ